MAKKAIILHYSSIEMLDRGKTLQLIGRILKKKSFVKTIPEAICTTLDFLCNLRMGHNVSLLQYRKARQGKTLQLIGPISKKKSFVKTIPEAICTTLDFLCNLRMGPKSYNVSLLQYRKAQQGKTLQLIGPISKKKSFVNTTPDPQAWSLVPTAGDPPRPRLPGSGSAPKVIILTLP